MTESAFTEDIPSRNKVGDTQGKTRLAIINAETGEAKFIDHGLKEPPKNPEDKTEKPRERDIRFFGLKWYLLQRVTHFIGNCRRVWTRLSYNGFNNSAFRIKIVTPG